MDAYYFAVGDQFRCTTHNKGVMNGIDAVVLATGNDFRAVEAGVHSFAAYTGSYSSLTHYTVNEDGDLVGSIEVPLPVGTVGGSTRTNPMAQVALKILGVKTAKELSEVMAAVGLAQNFAAIRALANEGIQQGHMKLHARNIAINAGAQGSEIDVVAEKMIKEKNISVNRALEILQNIKDAVNGGSKQ
jgi:hydroxymethylglutaryl-CoA reductase